MKLFGQLENASLELLASDPGTAVAGRIYFNTTTSHAMLDDGTLQRALLRNDQKHILGNDASAANNVRFNRAGAALLQLVPGSDTTAEGSASTTLAQFGFRFPNYATGSRPANGAIGRLVYDTTLLAPAYDDGTSYRVVFGVLTVAMAALNIDWSQGSAFYKAIAADSTLTMSNIVEGQTISLYIQNTDTVSHTITWPAGMYWSSGQQVTSVTNGTINVYTFVRINGKTFVAAISAYSAV